jgi:hypothetical protein
LIPILLCQTTPSPPHAPAITQNREVRLIAMGM